MKFELSEKQLKKFNTWKKKQKVPPMVAAIGGSYSFTFTPTGIGNFVEVKCNDNGKILNLTEEL